MRRLLKDPLIHFLAAGGALFALLSVLAPPEAARDAIIVDRDAILEFIQYRSKAFEPDGAAALLDAMTPAQQDALVADYVREEAMHREAKSLGLDAADYVIRQRLIQKIAFLNEGEAPRPPDEAALRDYFKQNVDRYRSSPTATLSHVFVSAADQAPAAALAEAARLRLRLVAEKAGLADAVRYGDRFLFHTNYAERTEDYIRSQLGDAVGDAVFNGVLKPGVWSEPILSDYGAHLVMVAAVASSTTPTFEKARASALADWTDEARAAAAAAAEAAIIGKYRVEKRSLDRPAAP